MLAEEVTNAEFTNRIMKKSRKTIAEAIMNQSVICGVGNYLKAEVLYRSGISPHRPVVELTPDEVMKLWSEVILSCRESYADQGASIRTYRTVDDGKGQAQFTFRIYNTKECPQGHPTIREETKDGRTSWWCKQCQK